MANMLNLDKVLLALDGKLDRVADGVNPSVIVGYTQNYAVYVHENMESHHPVGQAKFLEQPARQEGDVLGDIVNQGMRAGRTLAQSLVLAGLRLQRDSQLLVPVDTGALKGSAFTRLE